MKFQIPILLIVISLSAFVGCKKKNEYPTEYNMTDADKQWNIYHLNQEIKFESNLGNTITYVVTGINSGISEESMPTDDGGYSYTREYINIYFNRTDTIDEIRFHMTRGYPYSHGLFRVFGMWDNFSTFFSLPTANIPELTVNNTKYYAVIHASGNDTVSDLYYQKEKGFLRFDYTNDEIFERTN